MTTYVVITLFIVFAFALLLFFFWRARRHKDRLFTIERIKPKVEEAFSDISSCYNYGHYITESERLSLVEKYSALAKTVKQIINYSELNDSPDRESFIRMYKAMSNTAAHKAANNEHFIDNQLTNCSGYFDTVLAYPLDKQQREAVVSLEDNVLVISSAGSGKTLTTIGKVRYLIDIQHIPADKILLITFTRKAAEELSERLGEKDLKCRTFHKLALDIISETIGEKPTITPQDFSLQVYHKLYQDNPDFRLAVADYILRSRYSMKDQFEYDSMQDYMVDRQKFGIHSFYKDMDGRPVFCKSDEESKICDYLGSRGIKFRYEEKYEINTVDSEYRQYCPDFSIYYEDKDGHSKRVYLEHFAVNEYGRCPQWFSQEDEINYLQSIAWKRQLHQRYETTLLETSSADFHRGDVFEKLGKRLQELDVVFTCATQDSISRELLKQEENILAMLTSFNFLLKSKKGTTDSILGIIGNEDDRITVKDVASPFVKAYQQMEKELNMIDFTDAILWATDLCNKGHRPEYDYILVDEFQDISIDRYHFLQSLRCRDPLTKLFCVGDDWQSIYRFAGSDMALFKHFDEYFGYTKKCLMETTYRFGEPTIASSSQFILANPDQAFKSVHSFRNNAETELRFLPTNGREDIVMVVKRIVDSIPTDKEILLLGRYRFDVNVLKKSDLDVKESHDSVIVTYCSRRMTYLTVHQSKGLESDYVILLNCNGGVIGFPSQISDSPILRYVLSEPDNYAFSEERRIFYVGITRAKKSTWVLYDAKNPSPFVKEFINIPELSPEPSRTIPKAELCPKCKCGRVKVVKKGIAVNGNPFSVQICSNEKYGCDYRETVFVNLNAKYRYSWTIPEDNNSYHFIGD